jgi:hypothetical protein
MGQNVTALGYGVAMLHTPRLPDPEPRKELVVTGRPADALPQTPLPPSVPVPART